MYNNWKLFKTNNTYHSEVVYMCGDIISESEFQYYLENHGEIQNLSKSMILEVLSDGCSAGEYINLDLNELRKISYLNEIIAGMENGEQIPYPIFESYKGDLSCLDGRHRLLVSLKMNITPSIIVIDMIPANEDPQDKIDSFRKKYINR